MNLALFFHPSSSPLYLCVTWFGGNGGGMVRVHNQMDRFEYQSADLFVCLLRWSCVLDGWGTVCVQDLNLKPGDEIPPLSFYRSSPKVKVK